MKQIGKTPESSKEKKSTIPDKSEESISANMQPELEVETNPNTTEQVEYTKKDISEDTQKSDKEHVDHTSSEPVLPSKAQENSADKEIVIEEEQIECQEKASHSDTNREVEEHEENELDLRFETEDSPVKIHEEKADDADSKEDNSEKYPSKVITTKNDVNEKEDFQCESQTDTESNSADILECTTSEVSEMSEIASQNDVQNEKEKEKEKETEKEKEKENEKSEESISKDSFVSYNPSIMLKDVQIKLNDCLKENSKLFNTSNASQSTSSQSIKDMSFGKSLRNISGRRCLSRMRHVTLRERRYSPSDSMLVNVSSVSFSSDDTPDFKILRYSTDLSDTVSTTNGSPSERKRKHEIEDWNSAKKQKGESDNSLLNSSVSLLKGLRKPIQVSTPVSELKFQTGKLELGENNKPANENSKKWCVIM
ncbi:PREDICTED: myb-like protein X isoform X2 [Eufriesea mexicana]|nr:PREDICTED: myb-like protein X isoform X2 [Eufriesea mexicana]